MYSAAKKGKLFLIPNTLGSDNLEAQFPPANKEIILSLKHFIIEDLRTTRRFLKKFRYPGNFDDVEFFLLNKHTNTDECLQFLDPAIHGQNMGIISEAGTPCIADPGSIIVELAHQLGIRVIPMIGPNSIIMALMASGFNGQSFSFLGYLPIDKKELAKKLKELEQDIIRRDQTQIFIEAPYRNQKLLETILSTCSKDRQLCIASNLSLNDEFIQTKTINAWKSKTPDIHKKPTVFLLY